MSTVLLLGWQMRIFTRYILGEITSHALIGVAVFTFILFTRDLGRLLDLVVRNSAPLPSVFEIFFFTLPVALTYTIPMGVLVGILIGLSRLAADSEVTAMRASGIGTGKDDASVRLTGQFTAETAISLDQATVTIGGRSICDANTGVVNLAGARHQQIFVARETASARQHDRSLGTYAEAVYRNQPGCLLPCAPFFQMPL